MQLGTRAAVSAIRALGPDCDGFVTSETTDSGAEVLCMYDLNGGGVQGLSPVMTWKVGTGGVGRRGDGLQRHSKVCPNEVDDGRWGGAHARDPMVLSLQPTTHSPFPSALPRPPQEHKDMSSCLALHPSNPAVFFSGSKDKTVRIWDRRMAQCAGQCGMQDPNTFDVGRSCMGAHGGA